MASDSRSPAVPAGGPSRPTASPRRRGALRRASGPGSGAESPSSWETGCGRKGGRPHALHATHVRGEPGAKPFVDDLLLGRGFVRSRAAPSLRSIESQPSTQGFVALARALSLSRGLASFPRGWGNGRPPAAAAARRPRREGRGGRETFLAARAEPASASVRAPGPARRPSPPLREPRRGLRAADWDGEAGVGGGGRGPFPRGAEGRLPLSFPRKSRSTSTPGGKNTKNPTPKNR